jgi:hypothetical protein
MFTVQLRTQVDEKLIASRHGGDVTEEDIAFKPTSDIAVYKSNGQPLLFVFKRAVSQKEIELALPGLNAMRITSPSFKSNRKTYGGGPAYRKKEDGTVSNTTYGKSISSAIAGYFDRYPRFPFCRQTAFTAKEVEKWRDLQPMIHTCAKLFKEHLPERYENQDKVARKVHPDFQIAGTPFSTLTVNHNAVAKLHQDKGDLPDGFGVMTVIKEGSYDGFSLVFPRFRVGAELETGDVILFDPHEFHANVPPRNCSDDYHRISVVMYFRKKMIECGSAADEMRRAQKARGSLDIVANEGATE